MSQQNNDEKPLEKMMTDPASNPFQSPGEEKEWRCPPDGQMWCHYENRLDGVDVIYAFNDGEIEIASSFFIPDKDRPEEYLKKARLTQAEIRTKIQAWKKQRCANG